VITRVAAAAAIVLAAVVLAVVLVRGADTHRYDHRRQPRAHPDRGP